MNNMNKRGMAHLFLVILITIIGIGAFGYYAYKNGQIKLTPSQNQIVQSPTPAKIIDITDWKTYSSDVYKFSIQYPQDLECGLAGDDFGPNGYMTCKRDNNNIFTIHLALDFSPDLFGNFMGETPIGKKEFASETWSSYNFYYEDALVETLKYQIIAFEVIKNDKRYVIEFTNQKQLTPEQDQILSTFEFVDEGAREEELPSPMPTKVGVNCVVGGCNDEVCADENSGGGVSACVYKLEFACYSFAKCEVQENGECGWTTNKAFDTCLSLLP